jgi:enoyl-CoA hydratase/carnithine racemase
MLIILCMKYKYELLMMVKVKFEKEDQFGVITFMDKPLNLIDSVFIEELAIILSDLNSKNVRALLFKVDTGNFSAGANVGLLKSLDEEAVREMLQRFLDLIYQIEKFPYPTMAAVKGMCIGGGFEIALACDYIWASENAQFAAAEVLIGIVPLGGGAQRLAQRCGIARAKEITLGGRFVKPDALERWNVINRVLPEQELNEKAIKFMKFQSNGPTLALDTIKILLREYFGHGLEDSDKLLLNIVPKLFNTEDMKIGIESFMKQGPGKAIFKGK